MTTFSGGQLMNFLQLLLSPAYGAVLSTDEGEGSRDARVTTTATLSKQELSNVRRGTRQSAQEVSHQYTLTQRGQPNRQPDLRPSRQVQCWRIVSRQGHANGQLLREAPRVVIRFVDDLFQVEFRKQKPRARK